VTGRTFRIGTRGSSLALRQTEMVLADLRQAHPDATFETVTISTSGDQSTAALADIGGRGVFIIEIERALLATDIDIAVHSLKDLPAEDTPGLSIAATPAREDVRDVLVSRSGAKLSELPAGASVGTGSPRRAVQIRALRPDLAIKDIRGNVDTRLRKVDAGEYDAVALAAAGLKRLALFERATEVFETAQFLPAVGQGALAIQARSDDSEVIEILRVLDDGTTRAAVTAERAFERRLGGGCHAAIGALATVGGDPRTSRAPILLRAIVGSIADGRILRGEMEGPASEADMLGVRLAEFLIAQGAEELLEAGA
jgi:hydroxymethylbilane synthase